MTKKKLIAVKISEELLQQIDYVVALFKYANKSEIIRNALEIGLKKIIQNKKD